MIPADDMQICNVFMITMIYDEELLVNIVID